MTVLRFGAYQYQHVPLPELRERWSKAERLGFDMLWNCDTVVEPDRPGHSMFDGPATLALMAATTSRIRVGTLVTSLYFRDPVTLARAAMTVDHISGGRVEIALGVGDPSAGAATVGADQPVAERVARFAEFVELVDLLLRQRVTNYTGRFYRCAAAEVIPPSVQRPRPPITIAAHGPRMLRIAARYADSWSSWGGYEVQTEHDFYAVTAERTRRFDDLCADLGRSPAGVRHSVVCFPPLSPWESVDYFSDMIGRLRESGTDEFVLYWPQSWRQKPSELQVFEEVPIPSFRRYERRVDSTATAPDRAARR